MYISTDLDAIKTNDIWLFLLENDLTHSIFHFEVQCINFPNEGTSPGDTSRFHSFISHLVEYIEI